MEKRERKLNWVTMVILQLAHLHEPVKELKPINHLQNISFPRLLFSICLYLYLEILYLTKEKGLKGCIVNPCCGNRVSKRQQQRQGSDLLIYLSCGRDYR